MDNFALPNLDRFTGSEIGRTLLREFATNIRSIDQLHANSWHELTQLEGALHPDQAMLERIIAMSDAGLDVAAVNEYVTGGVKNVRFKVNGDAEAQAESASSRAEFLATLIKQGASVEELEPLRVNALKQFTGYFGAEHPLLPQLLALDLQGVKLSSLAYFASKNPTNNLPFLEKMVREGASAEQLKFTRLLALGVLNDKLDAATVEHLVKLEPRGVALEEVSSFLDSVAWFLDSSKSRSALISKLVAQDAAPQEFSGRNLVGRLLVSQQFGDDPATLKAVFGLIEQGLNMEQLESWLKGASEKRLSLVKAVIDAGASPQVFRSSNLSGLERLNENSEVNSPFTKRLIKLGVEGLDFEKTMEFVKGKPDINETLLRRLIEHGAGVGELDVVSLQNRLEVSKLAAHFDDPEVISYLDLLTSSRPSASRLMQFLNEKPDQRRALVEQLVRKKADVQRFNDQISLLVLPEPVAYELAEASRNGGMSVRRIVGNLRDLQFGQNFHDRLIEHVEAGKPLAASALEELASTARTVVPAASGSTPALVNGYKPSSTETLRTAAILRQSAAGIDAAIPGDKPIVLLGRDMGPVLPVLLARGRQAQYFLWTRLNNGPSTVKQWLREVPPSAAVVDSGYTGSIIDTIKKHDATVSGYLLSTSKSRYPRLLDDKSHSIMVGEIEGMGKLIVRSDAFTENGGAVSNKEEKLKVRSEAASSQSESDRFVVEADLRAILRAAGLTPWQAWRYSQYVGLTPQERLGVSSADAVQSHYKHVEALRNNSAAAQTSNP